MTYHDVFPFPSLANTGQWCRALIGWTLKSSLTWAHDWLESPLGPKKVQTEPPHWLKTPLNGAGAYIRLGVSRSHQIPRTAKAAEQPKAQLRPLVEAFLS